LLRSPLLASGERLHWRQPGQQFLDAMLTKEHRELELFTVTLAFLHHPTAKMLVKDLRSNRIDGRRCRGTADRD
jgi:hypothetical protein